MRKTAAVLATFGVVAALTAALPAHALDLLPMAVAGQSQTSRVVADLWLRHIASDQNLDGDHTTYYASIYRKQGPQGEKHLIVGPRPIGEWHIVDGKAVGPSVADRLIQANFRGDTRYVIRLTHGDGSAALPNDPEIEFALDAGNHVVAFVPGAMQCSATPDRQPGISLTAAHTWLWITAEQPGLIHPEIVPC